MTDELIRERDEWKARYEDQWAKNTTEDMAHGALESIQSLLDSGGIPRGTFADDQVRNLVVMYNIEKTRADDLEAEVADLNYSNKNWRKLAIQFDMHRIEAMSTIRGVVAGTITVEDCKKFLAAPPPVKDQ